jgi:hypothetical protein
MSNWLEHTLTWAQGLEQRRANHSEIPFEDFAYTELVGFDNPHPPVPSEIVKSLLKMETMPSQVFPDSLFGDLPITLYTSTNTTFYLDLYIWHHAHTSIHQHNFEGAFRLLTGRSLEGIYSFKADRAVGSSYWGRLEPQELRSLRPGSVSKIPPHQALIHNVLHIANPTLSLVLRTLTTTDSSTQYNYDFGCLASPPTPTPEQRFRLRSLIWCMTHDNSPGFKMFESLLGMPDLWLALFANKKSLIMIKKLEIMLQAPEGMLERISDQNIFRQLLKSLDDSDKELVAVYYFWRSSKWKEWAEQNLGIRVKDCSSRLIEAFKQAGYMDAGIPSKGLIAELVGELS